jgi:hypothetical protein
MFNLQLATLYKKAVFGRALFSDDIDPFIMFTKSSALEEERMQVG